MLGGSNQVDMSQNKIKVVIIIVLKLHLEVNPRQSLGHGSVGQLGLTRVNIKIKVIIIVVLKPDSKVNRGNAQVTS